ncbi:hypothetical protein [Streptomyces sp. WAC08241]|uniref:hypothetical protein n=1 Tax=Streptomyces sp. WAC08241 TaxID=2487421 RepID=UPI00163C1FFB|nr:hypothetical protein [Streptomyces sp. WAC08241]
MPGTVSLPDDDLPDEDSVDHERRRHRTYRDHLFFDIAAHTLFVVGTCPTACTSSTSATDGLMARQGADADRPFDEP